MKNSVNSDPAKAENPCLACYGEGISFSAGLRSYALHKCDSCGLVRTAPMPTEKELIHFYQGFAFEEPKRDEIKAEIPAIEASLRHFIGSPINGANRFLDYGGGFGIYCRAARNLGWEPSLFDYDQGCLDFARSEMGVEQAVGDLSAFEDRKFDVIFGFHVIEHWNQIDDNMASLLGLLAPGGRIVFATPNAESFEKYVRPYHVLMYARGLSRCGEPLSRALRLTLLPKSFLCWDPPRHLFAFTGDALRAIGRRHGLDSRIETGYNTSILHEPRQYVVASPFASRFKVAAGGSSFKSGLRAITACFSWIGCKVLSRLFPRWGEQLYVIYSRASS